MKELADEQAVAEHFTPTYNVWDQRLRRSGRGPFAAIKSGKAEVVTDHIDTIVAEGIRAKSGRLLEADIIVTATGLKLEPAGGIVPVVDGAAVSIHDQFVLLGAMITGIPNFAMAVGYTNASWTLRDLTSRLVCKVLTWMDEQGYASVVPQPRQTPRRAAAARPQVRLHRASLATPPQQGRRAMAHASELRPGRGDDPAHRPRQAPARDTEAERGKGLTLFEGLGPRWQYTHAPQRPPAPYNGTEGGWHAQTHGVR